MKTVLVSSKNLFNQLLHLEPQVYLYVSSK